MEAESNTNIEHKKRVLIVEDDLELVRIYENLLGGFQYEVSTATDGIVALQLANRLSTAQVSYGQQLTIPRP